MKRIMLPSLAFLLVASLGVGCSGCNGEGADTSADPANTEGTNADGSGVHGAGPDGASAHGTHTGDGHDHSNGMTDGSADATTAGTATSDPWTRTYATPAEERTGTVQNLQGLRATLVAELDLVRGRLKDGARTAEDKKADSTRAAELAQGLERLDRTIKQITEANDVTWTDVRESNIKAAGEFREWMAKYGMAS